MKKNELTGKMNVRRKLGSTGAIEGTVTDPTGAFSHNSPLRASGFHACSSRQSRVSGIPEVFSGKDRFGEGYATFVGCLKNIFLLTFSI
jgi:hypothetical protein